MVVVDLFSGAGGLTEGFVKAGFKIVAHVEKEKWACETLKTRICYHYLKEKDRLDLYNKYIVQSVNYNNINEDRKIIFEKFPQLEEKLNYEVLNRTFGDPEEDKNATSIEEIINLIEKALEYNKEEKVDVIIGGPPCQAYSLIGRGRMGESVENDKRNFLFKYYKEIVDKFKPEVFIFENVPGILSAHKGRIFKAIEDEFDEIGYKLQSGTSEDNPVANIIDASELGVYQSRKRVILFGSKEDLKYPDFKKYVEELDKDKNTWNAIGDLPPLEPGKGNDYFFGEYDNVSEEKLSKFQKLMREDSIGVLHHKARAHQDRDRKIYELAIRKAQESQQLKYYEIPEEYSTHKNKNDFEDRFKVHWWYSIPHTIVAHISKDGHYNIHPSIEQKRSLTVREAARIQSFPDNYKFEGPRTWQYVQIGNAVPPLMAEVIAKAVMEDCFKNPKYKKNIEPEQVKFGGI